jgi:SsrA-binding protein
MEKKGVNIVNKKARHEFLIFDSYVAGIQLTGTEIKSVREGKVSLAETYCLIEKGEVFVKNMNISEYSHGNIFNHEPKRTRKLLLTGREIRKLAATVREKGFTIIVLRMFINGKGYAKVEIALAKGKKLYDKREAIKEKDERRKGE